LVVTWTYTHQDLSEPRLPDGSPILRPCVVVSAVASDLVFLAVVDSGSPISAADPAFLAGAGVDVTSAVPVMEIPLGLGGAFGRVPVYEVELQLVPPVGVDGTPRRWRLEVAARPSWRFPFTVLLGQRGWFDTYPTTISALETDVHFAAPGGARLGR
jgi:hypothetical protein